MIQINYRRKKLDIRKEFKNWCYYKLVPIKCVLLQLNGKNNCDSGDS